MALKRARVEPTVDAVVARCPSAAYRDDTGEAFNKNLILEVRVCPCIGSPVVLSCASPHKYTAAV